MQLGSMLEGPLWYCPGFGYNGYIQVEACSLKLKGGKCPSIFPCKSGPNNEHPRYLHNSKLACYNSMHIICTSFSPISTVSLCLVQQADAWNSRSGNFHANNDDIDWLQTDYFTPCACAWGKDCWSWATQTYSIALHVCKIVAIV